MGGRGVDAELLMRPQDLDTCIQDSSPKVLAARQRAPSSSCYFNQLSAQSENKNSLLRRLLSTDCSGRSVTFWMSVL